MQFIYLPVYLPCLPVCLPICPSPPPGINNGQENLESSREETHVRQKGKGKSAAAKVPWSRPVPSA